ncbi:hypothetical protein A2U01_0056902, partial [Trifolium medium]|nr:hypothetical protein [Trifolium medium]
EKVAPGAKSRSCVIAEGVAIAPGAKIWRGVKSRA